jgi:hypothetical protein
MIHRRNILLVPLSQTTLISPEDGVTGSPEAVSIYAIRGDVALDPVSLYKITASILAPVTEGNDKSAESAAPSAVDLLVSVTGPAIIAPPATDDKYSWVDILTRIAWIVSEFQFIDPSRNRCLALAYSEFAI